MDEEIRKTLRNIFEYIGLDYRKVDEYSNNATLQTYLERLINKTKDCPLEDIKEQRNKYEKLKELKEFIERSGKVELMAK